VADPNIKWLSPPQGPGARTLGTFNLLIVSEGFRSSWQERDAFFKLAGKLAAALLASRPFNRWTQMLSIVAFYKPSNQSTASWTEVPLVAQDTAFRTHLGSQTQRLLVGDFDAVHAAKQAVVTDFNASAEWFVMGLLNSSVIQDANTEHARVSWVGLGRNDWIDTAIHELGHLFELGDEYEGAINGRVHAAAEPAFPNLTLARSRAQLKARWEEWASKQEVPAHTFSHSVKPSLLAWREMMRSEVLVEKPNPNIFPARGPFTRDDVPNGTVGLFEGGDHAPLGVFRPTYHCCMRDQTGDFCPICTWWIELKLARYLIRVSPRNSELPVQNTIPFTHAVAMSAPDAVDDFDRRILVLYHSLFGTYAILDYSKRPLAPAPVGSQDPSLLWLQPFRIGSTPYLIGYSGLTKQHIIYELRKTGGSFSLIRVWDSGLDVFDSSHGATFGYAGRPHVITYDWRSGALRISRIDQVGQAPAIVYPPPGLQNPSQRRNWTWMTTFTLQRAPYVLFYDAWTGESLIQSLDPPGFGQTTWATQPGFWTPGSMAIQPFEWEGRVFLLRTTAASQRAAFDRIRPGATGVDNVGIINVGWVKNLLATLQSPASSGVPTILVNANGADGKLEHLIVKTPDPRVMF
jgi:IgA peptidase M64